MKIGNLFNKLDGLVILSPVLDFTLETSSSHPHREKKKMIQLLSGYNKCLEIIKTGGGHTKLNQFLVIKYDMRP